MQDFIEKLGIDWRLLTSQVVNFLLLLTVLRLFAYKPVLKILKDRKRKIEEGLEKTAEAETKLHEVSLIAKEKIKEAEGEALMILKTTEERARGMESELIEKAHEKEALMMKNTERALQAKEEAAEKTIREKAAILVKEALVKTVEMDPEKIDEALIKKALGQIK
ncbi:MAG: hypothetical protein AAB652_00650 [Patescibacteria group bacterium]